MDTYARDDLPWGGANPADVVYVYAPDCKADWPITHPAGFKAILQVDGYDGYRVLADAAMLAALPDYNPNCLQSPTRDSGSYCVCRCRLYI